MLSLIIMENPSVAKNIADALKIKNRKYGYFEGKEQKRKRSFSDVQIGNLLTR